MVAQYLLKEWSRSKEHSSFSVSFESTWLKPFSASCWTWWKMAFWFGAWSWLSKSCVYIQQICKILYRGERAICHFNNRWQYFPGKLSARQWWRLKFPHSVQLYGHKEQEKVHFWIIQRRGRPEDELWNFKPLRGVWTAQERALWRRAVQSQHTHIHYLRSFSEYFPLIYYNITWQNDNYSICLDSVKKLK